VSDVDDDNLTYSIENLPSWATFNELTGKIEGTPTESDIATYEDITITVSDGLETASLDAFDIDVIAPIIFKTGQTTSYIDFDDGYYQNGKDMSYTRDDVNEIVTDNVTGLMWQDDAAAATITLTYSNAITYCENLVLGVYNDWRLPAIDELASIVKYGTYNPSADSVFQNIVNDDYLSSTTSIYESKTYALEIDFDDGDSGSSAITVSDYLRCVRGSSLNTMSLSRDDANDIVYDNNTGLVWQDNEDVLADTKNFTEAISYCQQLTLGGYNDWYVPSQRELNSINYYDDNAASSATDVFENIYIELDSVLDLYRTSTTSEEDTTKAFAGSFQGKGASGAISKTLKEDTTGSIDVYTYTMCVRGGKN
jgi:hypothetical protein